MIGVTKTIDLFNLSKCIVLIFSNKRILYLCNYNLNNSELSHVYMDNDLSIIFDATVGLMSINLIIQNKASSMFGFINRNCKSFCNPYALKPLYCTYIMYGYFWITL